MPQAAIIYVTEFLVTTFGITSYTAIAYAYFAATIFVYAATAYLLNRAAAAMAPKGTGGGGQKQGLETNYFDTGASIRIGYGRIKTGGMETIPPITSGQTNEYLHKVITLVGHEIDSFTHFHLDVTTFINNSGVIGPMAFTSSDGQVLSTSSYAGKAFIRGYRGTATDSADRFLCDADSVAFGKSRAPGISKFITTFKYDRDLYRGVPLMGATYQAKRCYDPRLDVTPGASPTNVAYIRWTQNSTLTLVDYLMSASGGDYTSADIDWPLAVVAANACDGAVAIPGATTQPRYTTNGLIYATEEFRENVKTLTNAMLGRVMFRDGKWRIYAGGWQTPTFSIQKKDWISGLSIRFEQGKRKRFNRMHTWFIDPSREWQRVESQVRINNTYKTADAGEAIDAETDQAMCTDEYEAQRKGEFLLRQSRNQIIVSGRLPPRMQNIALWDTGTIVFDHLGWSSKTFRCVNLELNPDGSLDGTFAEEQSSDWTDLLDSEYNQESTATLPLTNDTTASAPTNLAISNAIDGTLVVEISAPLINPVGTLFQLVRSTNSSNAAVGTVVWEGDTKRFNFISPASRHWFWARSLSPNGALSPYCPSTFGIFGKPGGFVTAQINTVAATEVAVHSTGLGGPVFISGPNSMTVYSNTLAYVNSTDRNVIAQAEFGMLAAAVSWNVGPPAVAGSFYRYSVNSTLQDTGDVVDYYETDQNYSPSVFIQQVLTPGDRFACDLAHELSHTAGASISYSSARIRLSVIKG